MNAPTTSDPSHGSELPSDASLSDASPSDATPLDATPSVQDSVSQGSTALDRKDAEAALTHKPGENFRIQLPGLPGNAEGPQAGGTGFEGPLDLLLHLIQKHELNVLDLPISFVTERYLEYLELMEELNLDMASDYLVMAATLAHIKSRMLLPKPPPEEEEPGEELDPREELIRRLLEYQKYKVAAEALNMQRVRGRDVFLRGSDPERPTGPAPLADATLFQLMDALSRIMERTRNKQAFEVSSDRISIQDRIQEITERIRATQRTTFESLFDQGFSRYDIVITFMAILEMAKSRLLRVYQANPTSALYLESAVMAAGDLTPEEDDPAQGSVDDEMESDTAGVGENDSSDDVGATHADEESDAIP